MHLLRIIEEVTLRASILRLCCLQGCQVGELCRGPCDDGVVRGDIEMEFGFGDGVQRWGDERETDLMLWYTQLVDATETIKLPGGLKLMGEPSVDEVDLVLTMLNRHPSTLLPTRPSSE